MINIQQENIPIKFARKSLYLSEPVTVLAGVIRKSVANLAYYKFEGDQVQIIRKEQFHSDSFSNISQLLKQFLKGEKVPERACLVMKENWRINSIQNTDISFNISPTDIRKKTGIESLHILNEAEAVAYGLARLDYADISVIQRGDNDNSGNVGIIAPGETLEEAGLYWDGGFYNPFTSYGGKTTFSPASDDDLLLYRYIEKKYGNVQWERVLSYEGIFNIYCFLRDIKKLTTPLWLVEKMRHHNEAYIISQYASSNQCQICTVTMKTFFRLLAEECTDFALKINARGGIYIDGSITPYTRHLLDKDEFIRFFLKGVETKELLKKIPIKILLNEQLALKGAAYYTAYS